MAKSVRLFMKNLSLIPKNVIVPSYNRSQVTASIVHVGVGGFHRSHQALYAERLLAEHGITDCGICGVGLLSFDKKIYEIMKEQDCLYTLITKELDGTVNGRVIGSIVDFLFAPENPLKVIEKMSSPEVKIISLTITEGGYNYKDSTNGFDYDNPAIIRDTKNQDTPNTVFGYLKRALRVRMDRGTGGCSILSCDNIQGNGDMTKTMLECFIKVIFFIETRDS
jgi:mannitol 2-dehydrogenase